MRKFAFLLLFIFFLKDDLVGQNSSIPSTFKKDKGFFQEYHEAYPVADIEIDKNIRSIVVDNNNNVFIATSKGLFKKNDGEKKWSAIPFQETTLGPCYTLTIDAENVVWIGSWNGLYRFQNNLLSKTQGIEGPISALCPSGNALYALGPNGVWSIADNKAIKKDYPIAHSIRYAISDRDQGLWVASDVGIYHCKEKTTSHFYKTDLLLSAEIKGLAFDDNDNLWAAGLGGVSILKDGLKKKFITSAEGCPSVFVRSVKKAPDGTMWVGTKVGVLRFAPDGSHSLLFSRRWLLDDQVVDIAFDKNGNAWIATAEGVSAIKKKWITLEDKQDYFYAVQMSRHIREPWISGQCHLISPGDTSRWVAEDDDNDGEYTGNYLAMESFRYAVTKSEDARAKAQKAFHFLKLLKDITNGDGYFARTMVPIEWADRVHDSNHTYSKMELAEELVNEPRFKPVETRWHKSADGKWLWKGDASSDEWCGHMMGYFFYYELAANEDEKKIIREHVASLVDHLIAHDFCMMDADGKHTRWSVWSPSLLNNDPEWQMDRCQNSMELLTFLKFAYYLTKDEKYQQQYLRLIHKEHYLDNMTGIFEQNPAWFIYFDVMLQAYLYPILLHCEKDPRLLAFYQQHIDKWMGLRKNDKSPLINFIYCYSRDKKEQLQASIDFLKDTPLDLVDWNIDHTKREDIKLVHSPILNELQINKLPPPSIRNTVRWDRNPWDATGGSPDVEREPVFWLLPYWMGRYLKMIQ